MARKRKNAAEQGAWALACALIEKEAWLAGLRKSALEEVFEIGDGSGRVWRSWRSGNRLPNSTTRRLVLSQAERRGWLTPSDRHLVDLAQLPEIHLIEGGPDIKRTFVAPEPIYPFPMRLPRVAAAMLLRDALNRRMPTYSSTPHLRSGSRQLSAVADSLRMERRQQVEDWTSGVKLVVHLLEKYSQDVVLAILERAYLKRFNVTKTGQ